jgi:hypothetical protein
MAAMTGVIACIACCAAVEDIKPNGSEANFAAASSNNSRLN